MITMRMQGAEMHLTAGPFYLLTTQACAADPPTILLLSGFGESGVADKIEGRFLLSPPLIQHPSRPVSSTVVGSSTGHSTAIRWGHMRAIK